MTTKPRQGLVDLLLGPLPEDTINRTLGLELDPGPVILSKAAQIHASRRHPTEYPLCQPFAASIIENPLYIGDDFKNPGIIELIGYAGGISTFILVAVSAKKDLRGNYGVASLYPVSREKIDGRRNKGFLRVALTGKTTL